MSETSISPGPLQQERDFFAASQAAWKLKFPGKYVLVKGESLINTFNKAEDAVNEGIELYGSESFLVRHVDQSEENLFIPALAFGILRFSPASD